MAAIPIQNVPDGGLASLTFAAAANGDTIADGGKRAAGYDLTTMLLIVRNTNGATRDVTVGAGSAVTCPATTGISVIPVFSEGIGDPSVLVTYSALTGLEVAAVLIGA